MKLTAAAASVVAIMSMLSACHPLRFFKQAGLSCRDANPYLQAASIPPLKIPPGLDAPDSSNALHIPALNEPPPPPRKKTDPCLDEPPSFKVATKPAEPAA